MPLQVEQGRELAVQVALHVLGVIGLEGTIVGLLEQDDDGYHFAGAHLPQAHTLSLTRRKQGVVPARSKLLPEIVYGTKEFEYTNTLFLLRRGFTTKCFCTTERQKYTTGNGMIFQGKIRK